MTASSRTAYIARINRVVDHVAANLAAPLDLQSLAEVAHFSPWHFHRVFHGASGETLADCVRRLRLEAAADLLLRSPPRTVLAVALDVGFASAEVFTRAFSAHFGMTPTAWRRGGSREWARLRHRQLHKIHQDAGTLPGDDGRIEKGVPMNVEMKTLPPMRLAYMRHTGPYGTRGINETWQRFMPWCAAHKDEIANWQTYGISQDNPEVTPPEKCRYDCCVEVKPGFKPQGEVGVQEFAGGRYACAPSKGTPDAIHTAWRKMFSDWLPASGWQPGDAPTLELYEANFEANEKTGEFSCWLCVPVKPL